MKQHNGDSPSHVYKELLLPTWVELMSALLIELCKQHHISIIDHLVQFVKDTTDFNCCANAFFQHIDFDFLVQFNQLNRFVVSEINNYVFSPTHIYSLLHWKILALLIRLSDDSVNLYIISSTIETLQHNLQEH